MRHKISFLIAFAIFWGGFLFVTNRSVATLPRELTIHLKPLAYNVQFQLFYDVGRGYNPDDKQTVNGGVEGAPVIFSLPADTIRSMRVDPGFRPGIFYIESIDFGMHRWNPDEITRDFRPNNFVSDFHVEGNAVRLETNGEDPQLVFQGDMKKIYADAETQSIPKRRGEKYLLFTLLSLASVVAFFFLRWLNFDKLLSGIIKMKQVGKLAIVLSFLLMLWLPIIASKMNFSSDYKMLGNNRTQEPPDIKRVPLSEFPRLYEKYFNDNFGLRSSLIRYNNLLKVVLLKTSPMAKVILGKNGFLFYDSDHYPGDGVTIKDHRGLAPLTDDELERIRKRLEANRDSLSQMGIAYVLAVAPNKNTIYPEYLPDYINRVHPETRLDQLNDYLAKHSSFRLVDLREALTKAKSMYPTYYPRNSHWNVFGAYIAYAEIMKAVSTAIPQVAIVPLSEFSVTPEKKPSGDVGDMLAIGDILGDDDMALKQKGTLRKQSLGKMIFLRDSFGNWLNWYFSFHFDPLIDIQQQHYYDLKRIEAEQPRIVVHVIAERYIDRLF